MTDTKGESRTRGFPLVSILAVGFAGGVVASFVVAALKWVPEVAANIRFLARLFSHSSGSSCL